MASVGIGQFVLNNNVLSYSKTVIQFLDMPLLAGVRLEVSSYEEVWDSKVSSQMVIDFNTGKQVITDSIAPLPRTWELTCYIGSATVAYGLSAQAFVSPKWQNPTTAFIIQSVNKINTANNLAAQQISSLISYPLPGYEPSIFFMPSLKQQLDILKQAWSDNKLVWFRDKYKINNAVAIENLRVISDPTIGNKIPLKIRLKEVITYNNSVQPSGKIYGSATVPNDPSNPASSCASVGSVNATTATNPP